jgi:hypothetical protein
MLTLLLLAEAGLVSAEGLAMLLLLLLGFGFELS